MPPVAKFSCSNKPDKSVSSECWQKDNDDFIQDHHPGIKMKTLCLWHSSSDAVPPSCPLR